MSRFLKVLPCIALLLFLACSATAPEATPFLRGVITSRASYLAGADSIPAMFVDGVGIWPAAEPCAARATIWIGKNTGVVRQTSRGPALADTGQLLIGRLVTVWASGVVLESCPPITGADQVLIEAVQ